MISQIPATSTLLSGGTKKVRTYGISVKVFRFHCRVV